MMVYGIRSCMVGFTVELSRWGCIIVTVLFTASSVRVDRRGTCSIGSRSAAADARA